LQLFLKGGGKQLAEGMIIARARQDGAVLYSPGALDALKGPETGAGAGELRCCT
jgi:hypothetical protein